MTRARPGTVLEHVRRVAAAQAGSGQTDSQLLHEFAARRDGAAFAALVGRHGPMVLGVCRHLLRHQQDAEDVFQATFLALARNPTSVRKQESLASWLHGVAYRMAMSARRAAARRRAREGRAKRVPPPNPSWELAWREVQAILDEELQRLPEKYRAPFLLCRVEGESRAEAARRLGVKEGTLSSRLDEARKRLRERLRRRGVTLSAVLVATALADRPGAATVPAPLVAATVKAALQLRACQTVADAAISDRVAGLVEGARKTMLLTKLRTAALLVLAGVIVSVSGVALLSPRESAARPEPPPGQVTAPPAELPQRRVFLEEKGGAVTVGGRVLDPDGKPFAGAKLYVWVDSNYEKPVKALVRATSEPDGRFRLTFAKQDIADVEEQWVNARPHPWRQAVIVAAAPGYGAGWAGLAEFEKGEAALRLVKDAPVKGRVRDLQGRPVAGAVVQVRNIGNLYRPAWVGLPEQVTTGKDGRLTLTGIGRGRQAVLRIAAPAIQLQLVGFTAGGPDATFEVIAAPCKPIEGVVRAKDTGKPLPGVAVYAKHSDFLVWNDDPHGVRAVTDDQGRYRLLGLPKSNRYEVKVYPRAEQGYLSAIQQVGDTEGLKPIALDYSLRRGALVRFRLIDKETRQPVRGFVQYTPARRNPLWAEAVAPYNPGLILPPIWARAPSTGKDGFIQFVAYPGHGAIIAQAGWAGGGPYLKARLDPEDEKKGYYPLGKGEPNNGFLNIANGYKVIDTDKTDKPLTFDIELTSGRALKGTLVGPDARPVTGATAYGLTFDAAALGRTDWDPPLAPEVLKADAFTALGLYPKEPRTLSFAHKGRKLVGHVIVDGTEKGPLTVRLEPWGELTGRLVDEQGKPLAGVVLRLHYPELPRPGFLWRETEFRTDQQGRFRVEGLLPRLRHGLALVADPKQKVTLSAGEALAGLSAAAGEVKNLGEVRVKVVPVK